MAIAIFFVKLGKVYDSCTPGGTTVPPECYAPPADDPEGKQGE